MRDSIRSRRRRISAPSRPPLPPPAVPPDGRTASILPLPGSFASRGEVSCALPAAPAGAGTGASPPGRMTTPGDCGAGPSGDGSRITANEGAAGRPSVAGRIPCLRGLSAGGAVRSFSPAETAFVVPSMRTTWATPGRFGLVDPPQMRKHARNARCPAAEPMSGRPIPAAPPPVSRPARIDASTPFRWAPPRQIFNSAPRRKLIPGAGNSIRSSYFRFRRFWILPKSAISWTSAPVTSRRYLE